MPVTDLIWLLACIVTGTAVAGEYSHRKERDRLIREERERKRQEEREKLLDLERDIALRRAQYTAREAYKAAERKRSCHGREQIRTDHPVQHGYHCRIPPNFD